MSAAKEAIAKAPSGRPVRQPVGSRNRLTVAKRDPNYVYRWVADNDGTGDRITEFKNAGYELVPTGKVSVGDSRVDVGGDMGTVEAKQTGGGRTSYLMRQKKEYYEEDQRAKQVRVDKTEAALKKPTSLDGAYGNIEIKTE